jgi:hypothetical protein
MVQLSARGTQIENGGVGIRWGRLELDFEGGTPTFWISAAKVHEHTQSQASMRTSMSSIVHIK